MPIAKSQPHGVSRKSFPTKETGPSNPQLRRRLRAWYRRNARDLPWRRTADPYAIWISEIMLQQTTVAAVIPYYQRFLAKFPDIQSLAAADQQQVLRLWEGLGYYRRARQLHTAAQVIASQHGGEFPSEFDKILTLPGIGRYTAGAIASFAYDQRQPIVEANTARLYARLLALKLPLTSSAAQEALWGLAQAIVPARKPGEFNQALIELGATICTPRDPQCEQCPLIADCQAHRRGWQNKIPVPAKKPVIEDVTETAVAICANGRWLLIQRAADERWAGMWDFPRVKTPSHEQQQGNVLVADSQSHRAADIRTELHQRLGVTVRSLDEFVTIRHTVTRFRITLNCLQAEARLRQVAHPARWFDLPEMVDLPLTTPARRIAKKLA